ncbi:hypothetical protein ACQP1P_20405 [Dactylosporangium sp. CA-052675]
MLAGRRPHQLDAALDGVELELSEEATERLSAADRFARARAGAER